MPFATIWMDLEIIILSKSMSERQIPYVTYMWSLKYDTNQHIYKTKTDSQRRDLWLPSEEARGGEGMGVWDQHRQSIIYRMDKQQGLIVQHWNSIF